MSITSTSPLGSRIRSLDATEHEGEPNQVTPDHLEVAVYALLQSAKDTERRRLFDLSMGTLKLALKLACITYMGRAGKQFKSVHNTLQRMRSLGVLDGESYRRFSSSKMKVVDDLSFFNVISCYLFVAMPAKHPALENGLTAFAAVESASGSIVDIANDDWSGFDSVSHIGDPPGFRFHSDKRDG